MGAKQDALAKKRIKAEKSRIGILRARNAELKEGRLEGGRPKQPSSFSGDIAEESRARRVDGSRAVVPGSEEAQDGEQHRAEERERARERESGRLRRNQLYMQNRLPSFSEGDYEDSYYGAAVGLDPGAPGPYGGSGHGAGGFEARTPAKSSLYFSSEVGPGLLGGGGRAPSVGYYGQFGAAGGPGHAEGGAASLEGELAAGQAPWGWETYTSYNMVGLFSAHTGNRRIRPFITSICCDPFYELLWLGWTNGFLSSFRFPHCSRYTAFPVGVADSGPAGRDNVLFVGFSSASHLYTVTNSGIGVYSRGGAPISSRSHRALTGEAQSSRITCCDSSRYSSYMMNTSPVIGVGTGKGVSILDLQGLRPVHNIPYSGSISCIKSSSSSSSFIVGGVNTLAVADSRLPRLGHTIQIHSSGSGGNETLVSGLAVNGYTVAVITSSVSARRISSAELLSSVGGVCGLPVLDLIRVHPGEVSTSPEMMVHKKNLDLSGLARDSVVRLYDVRKFRSRKNITFSPGPINIAWSDNSLAVSAGAAAAPDFQDLYIVGNNGQWQIYHSSVDQMEFYATPSVPLSNICFSSSGNYLVLGDTSGSVHTMQRPHSGIQSSVQGGSSIASLGRRPDRQQVPNPVLLPGAEVGTVPGPAPGPVIAHAHGAGPVPVFGFQSQHHHHHHHQLSFGVFQSYPLPSLGLPGLLSGRRQGAAPLYNYSHVKSIQTLMGIASNPVAKPLTHNVGGPTAPNLTVALRYLQGRPVVAYDSLNSIGVPPVLERLQNGRLHFRDDDLLSFGNRFDLERIQKIQADFGWGVLRVSDELPSGVSVLRNRVPSEPAHGTGSQRKGGEPGQGGSSGAGSAVLFLDYLREIRPELDRQRLKNLDLRTVEFFKISANPDPAKYRNNNLVYGVPLLSLGGSVPFWLLRKRRALSQHSAGPPPGPPELSHAKSLSLVPSRFQYRPRLNPSRREKPKGRRTLGSSGAAEGPGFPNGGEAQPVQRPEDEQGQAAEGVVAIEFDNDSLDFTQPFFMLFLSVPRLCYDILLSHVPGCASEFCLACELVHLAFMLYSCRYNLRGARSARNADLFPCVILSSVYTLNIFRAIRHLPEAGQLGVDSEDAHLALSAGGAATGSGSG
ncbi:Exonuclease family protein, partial [Cryptosporidium felis]